MVTKRFSVKRITQKGFKVYRKDFHKKSLAALQKRFAENELIFIKGENELKKENMYE